VRTLLVTTIFVISGLASQVSTAAAAPWVVQPTRPAAIAGRLYGVSCAPPTGAPVFCMAVGEEIGGGVTAALSLELHGAVWIALPTPAPRDSVLYEVSCIAANLCRATGAKDLPNGTTVAFVEVWNGAVWRFGPAVNPAPGHSELRGISCTGAASCAAVGSLVRGNQTFTLVELWNGANWRVQPSQSPTPHSELFSVSCAWPLRCTAVGAAQPGQTLIEQNLAGPWRATPNAPPGNLTSVSCLGALDCVTAGFIPGQPRLLAWHPPPAIWRPQLLPALPAMAIGLLFGDSCTKQGTCVAVGSLHLAPGQMTTLVLGWKGPPWAIQPTPMLPAQSIFYNTSCTALPMCAAVGATGPDILIERS
jgi:hypothetical protein